MSVVRLIERGESNDPPEGHAARGLWYGVRITGPKWFPLVRRVGWRPPLQSVEVHRAPTRIGYRDLTVVAGAGSLSLLAFPDVSLALAEIFS